MKKSKKILNNQYVQAFLCWLVHLYIRFVYLTCKWDRAGFEHAEKLAESGKPIIFVFWHSRLLMMPYCAPKNININIVISNHLDGQLIAKTIGFFGFKSIRGSTTKDAIKAYKEIVKTLKNGDCIGITPDGPKGPRMRIGGNVVRIAQKMQIPIIVMTYATKSCKLFNSWDRFMLPKPFSRGALRCSEPIWIDGDDLPGQSKRLEEIMNDMTMEVDKNVGITPVEPAEN